MTREEAIHHLYTYSSTNGSGQTTDEQHNEAKRMAIKALEQEPTPKNDLGVDCISRDEVCRYVAEFVNHEGRIVDIARLQADILLEILYMTMKR